MLPATSRRRRVAARAILWREEVAFPRGGYMQQKFLGIASVLLAISVGTPNALAQQIDRDTGLPIGPGGYRGLFSSSPVARTTVSFDDRRYKPGSIIINTAERRLYYVLGEGRAIRYGIGVGRIGFTWAGTTSVSQKREWPDWTPPPQMLKRRPDLPRWMKGGPDNPLGARAIYLGSTLYRIHGSNEPETIGQAVSSGCFRMTNEDVIHLYNQVKIGAAVHVLLK
jgi:lipoprotein-anchoring transpeptidase ErfK/SrfK